MRRWPTGTLPAQASPSPAIFSSAHHAARRRSRRRLPLRLRLDPSRPRLPALNAEDAAVALGLAAIAGLEGRVMELQAALEGRLRELEQLRRRDRESEGSKGEEASKRLREGADEPEVAGAEAEVQVLQHQLGTVQESASGMKDAMLALRLQAEEMQALEEFWKPVVPVPQPQRNNSKGEEMQALEEFWKPVVPVRQRINSKINWKQIISLIALTSGLVPYISFWTLLPVNNLIHIVGAISVLWILRSTYSSCCQRFRTSRTLSRHVPRLIYVCFSGSLICLLGKHRRDSDGSTSGTSS